MALGYIAGCSEAWPDNRSNEPIATFANARAKEERRYAGRGIPPQLFDVMYGCRVFRTRLLDSDTPEHRDRVARLRFLFERLVIPLFQKPPREHQRRDLQATFDLGVSLGPYLRWAHAMDKRGIDVAKRWSDLALVDSFGDRLATLHFPLSVAGCTVDINDTFGYQIASAGALGALHVTTFLSENDHVEIVSTSKSGLLGGRSLNVPLPRHVEALRSLGFASATFPDGKRYALSGRLGGIRRTDRD